MNILRRIQFLFRKDRLDAEMAEEMQAHVALQTERNRKAGMKLEDARYAALRQFGNVAAIQEQAREARNWVWLEQLGKDLMLAGRTLWGNRGFSITAIVTLAVGIAATATLFSLVNGLVRDPLPYPEPDRLAPIWRKNIGAVLNYTPLSTLDVLDLQERASSYSDIGAFSVRRFNLGGERAEAVEGALVTAGLFRALGVQPLHGRWFAPQDEAGEESSAVILSHALWQQRFAGDPGCVGRTVRLDGREHTIVGVMPEGFAVLSMWTRTRPLALWSLLTLRRGTGGGAASLWLGTIARLKPGATPSQASEELKVIARELAQADPGRNPNKTFWSTSLVTDLGGLPALRVSVLLGAGWTLLVLAAQNVAGMLLARGIRRQPEMAVRLALGARRGHILRLVLMESLLLSLLASVGGFVLTLWGLSALAGLLPAEVLPRAGLHVDASLLGSIVVLTLLSTQMSGLAPALLASRTDVVSGIKNSGFSAGPARKTQRKLRNLVVGQIAMALLLVAIALQLSGTYRGMLDNSRALVSDSIFTGAVAVSGPAYRRDESRVAFWQRLMESCAALPGVREAAVTSKLPLDGGISTTVLIDDEAYDPAGRRDWTELSFVSPGFFAAIDARLVQGRFLVPADDLQRRRAVVINQAMARRYWPGQNPLGRHIRPAQEGKSWSAEVVGVIADVRQVAERPARPEMYFPFADGPRSEAFLVLHLLPGVPAPAALVRQELGKLDSNLALADARTLAELFQSQGRVLTVVTSVVDVLTVAIILLAALGLYGTLSFHFARRRRDIGIRLALGASPRAIVRLVFRQAAVWVGVGLGMGMAGAWLLSLVLRRTLADAGPFNVMGVTLGAVIIIGVALLAAWLPARRATKVDPMEALRAE
jgi:predicted permease